MTNYVLPISPSGSELTFITNTKIFTSPFTGTIQTGGRNGNRWVISLSFQGVTGDRAGDMKGFLMKMKGQLHRFVTGDPAYAGARGALQGTPLVAGAAQTGSSLNTDGWGAGTPTVLKAGDYFQIANELKMVTADVVVAAGAATITFEPELRAAPANNAPIITLNPVGVFYLNEPAISWSDYVNGSSSFSFSGTEDVTA